MKYLLTLALLSAPVLAQDFAYKRQITLPEITTATSVEINLDLHAKQHRGAYWLERSGGGGVAFKQTQSTVNLLKDATVLAAPPAADTVPPSEIAFLSDDNPETVFQPATGTKHRFVFELPEPVAPTHLRYQLQSGVIESVRVQQGMSLEAMRPSFVGTPTSTQLPLSGERAQVFEVVVETKQGVLKIAEVELLNHLVTLVMIAEPGESYELHYGASSDVTPLPNDDVFVDANTVNGTLEKVEYIGASGEDNDGDGVPDSVDVCPRDADPQQLDRDHDGLGDACDNAPETPNQRQVDTDKDGVGDAEDNCPRIANEDQKDVDLDGIGWVCDDADGDGVVNSRDNCVGLANPDQQDLDNSGRGDACEDDRDGDGIPRSIDNCSSDANPVQADEDRDGIGDVCDVCPEHYDPKQLDRDENGIGDVCQRAVEEAVRDTDGDGTPDSEDTCPTVAHLNQVDSDADGIGDICDNCPNIQNTQQRDRNRNGKGDLCEDTDQDGILDPFDNCVAYANTDQRDQDEDGIGNPCDDDDGDRVVNAVDNCPQDYNPVQADEDSDGLGNVCDATDDRWSEQRPWLLWASIAAIVVVLTLLAVSVLKRAPPTE